MHCSKGALIIPLTGERVSTTTDQSATANAQQGSFNSNSAIESSCTGLAIVFSSLVNEWPLNRSKWIFENSLLYTIVVLFWRLKFPIRRRLLLMLRTDLVNGRGGACQKSFPQAIHF